MKQTDTIVSDLACWVIAVVFLFGLLVLAVRLRDVQVVDSADYNYASTRQSIRRVQTGGLRGRILDRHGEVLAGNRATQAIVCNPAQFQKKSWSATVGEIERAVSSLAAVIGRPSSISTEEIRRHVNRSLARPLVIWRRADPVMLARFFEHEDEHPGFFCMETEERVYPQGSLAAHLVGYVGRDRGESAAGDEKYSYFTPELRGRAGLEIYYDGYLRGVSGETKVLVDARGFAIREWVVQASSRGLDLNLTLDLTIQRAVERELQGERGACVVIAAKTGEILAFASAPTFDPNEFVPILKTSVYRRFADDPLKPLLNRASGGAYAPGSTFKPVVALAALSSGVPSSREYCCYGLYEMGGTSIHCASRWGHGELDLPHALMRSCNPYFCDLGVSIGTNAICRAARAFGLGQKTGLDLGVDMAGVVPDGAWKMKTYHTHWFAGDVAQMSIGQGMLLVSPIQMARLAGGIATGYLTTPHFKRDTPVERVDLPFATNQLAVVRRGMEWVVNGDGETRGTGRSSGDGVCVRIAGKTGTAEVGAGEARYKNAWFIAYAPAENPSVAIAMVIEHGDTGGGTTAPKVGNILRTIFNE